MRCVYALLLSLLVVPLAGAQSPPGPATPAQPASGTRTQRLAGNVTFELPASISGPNAASFGDPAWERSLALAISHDPQPSPRVDVDRVAASFEAQNAVRGRVTIRGGEVDTLHWWGAPVSHGGQVRKSLAVVRCSDTAMSVLFTSYRGSVETHDTDFVSILGMLGCGALGSFPIPAGWTSYQVGAYELAVPATWQSYPLLFNLVPYALMAVNVIDENQEAVGIFDEEGEVVTDFEHPLQYVETKIRRISRSGFVSAWSGYLVVDQVLDSGTERFVLFRARFLLEQGRTALFTATVRAQDMRRARELWDQLIDSVRVRR